MEENEGIQELVDLVEAARHGDGGWREARSTPVIAGVVAALTGGDDVPEAAGERAVQEARREMPDIDETPEREPRAVAVEGAAAGPARPREPQAPAAPMASERVMPSLDGPPADLPRPTWEWAEGAMAGVVAMPAPDGVSAIERAVPEWALSEAELGRDSEIDATDARMETVRATGEVAGPEAAVMSAPTFDEAGQVSADWRTLSEAMGAMEERRAMPATGPTPRTPERRAAPTAAPTDEGAGLLGVLSDMQAELADRLDAQEAAVASVLGERGAGMVRRMDARG